MDDHARAYPDRVDAVLALHGRGHASGQVCSPSWEVLTLPKTIRVWQNGSGQDGLVHTVDFKFYVKHVLPHEWIADWNDDSLEAGAMAVKSFAWWHATHAHHVPGPAGCYDVDATTAHQRFDPFDSDSRTDDAVDATWDFYMIEGSGVGADVVQAFYRAGYKDNPLNPKDWDTCGEFDNTSPPPGEKMSQWGSHSCAQDGLSWDQILETYYFPPEVSWKLLEASDDSDADGCTNGQEVGNNEGVGGRRNPLHFWDFYDVWTHPVGQPSVWVKDKVINLSGDVIGVASRFGTGTAQSKEDARVAALTEPVGDSGYHPAFDRGPVVGANKWDRAPPDGVINIPDDILGVAGQFGHDCT